MESFAVCFVRMGLEAVVRCERHSHILRWRPTTSGFCFQSESFAAANVIRLCACVYRESSRDCSWITTWAIRGQDASRLTGSWVVQWTACRYVNYVSHRRRTDQLLERVAEYVQNSIGRIVRGENSKHYLFISNLLSLVTYLVCGPCRTVLCTLLARFLSTAHSSYTIACCSAAATTACFINQQAQK